MIAIKGMEMPKGCWYSTNLKMSGITTCPLKSYCFEKHIKEAPLDTRPSDCPLVEIGTCKECKYYTVYEIEYFQTNQKEQFSYCEKYERLGNNHLSPDFYCGDFKKRGSENE